MMVVLFLLAVVAQIIIIIPGQVVYGFEENSFVLQVKNKLENKKEQIKVSYQMDFDDVDIDRLNILVKKAVSSLDDYNQFNVKGWQIEIAGNNKNVDITIDVNYYSNAQQDRFLFKKIDEIINEITDPYMGTHKKIKNITDYIAANVRYDNSKQRYSAYDALINGESTCQGYALLTYLMLNQVDVENKIIRGNMDDQKHAWNLVKVNGNWYHLDLTQISSHFQKYGQLIYNEYMVSDRALSLKYIWNQGEYPQAVSSYFSQLKQEIKYTEGKLYDRFINELNLFYLEDKYTVGSNEELKDKTIDLLQDNKNIVELRLTDSTLTQSDISNVIMETINENNNLSNIYKEHSCNQ